MPMLTALLGFGALLLVVFLANLLVAEVRSSRALPTAPLIGLLPPPGMTNEDRTWLVVFRETVEASGEKLSPFLERHLSTGEFDYVAVWRHAENIIKEANEQAALIRGQAQTEVRHAVESARQLALNEAQTMCGIDNCKTRPDPRCGAGKCSTHCILGCPAWCRIEGHKRTGL